MDARVGPPPTSIRSWSPCVHRTSRVGIGRHQVGEVRVGAVDDQRVGGPVSKHRTGADVSAEDKTPLDSTGRCRLDRRESTRV